MTDPIVTRTPARHAFRLLAGLAVALVMLIAPQSASATSTSAASSTSSCAVVARSISPGLARGDAAHFSSHVVRPVARGGAAHLWVASSVARRTTVSVTVTVQQPVAVVTTPTALHGSRAPPV